MKKNLTPHLGLAAAVLLAGAVATAQVHNIMRTDVPADKRTAMALIKSQARQQTNRAVPARLVRPTESVALPYSEHFDTEDSFDTFVVLDENDDMATWGWKEEDGNGYAEYDGLFQDEDSNADDWLIGPGLELKAGVNYDISFKTCVFLSEELTVMLGTGDTPDEMSIQVMPTTTLENDEFLPYTKTITVPADGVYYLGFHCTTPSDDTFSLMIDDITVAEGATSDAPAAVSGLTVTPAPLGELKAEVAFVAPTTTMSGMELSALSAIVVQRNDTEIARYDNPATGAEFTLTDDSPVNGWNTYSVVAYAGETAGDKATLTAFVGEDIPSVAEQIEAKNVGDDVVVTWSVSEVGWNGRYVNPALTTVDIWETPDGINRTAVATNVTGTEYVVSGRNTGKQQQAAYQLVVNNKAGSSQRAYSQVIIVGAPYELPFAESVSTGSLDNDFWLMSRTNNKDYFMATADDDMIQDGDNGALLFRSANEALAIPDTLSAQTGKIKIQDAEHPQLSFYHRSDADKDATLTVCVEKDNEILLTRPATAYSTQETEGWIKEVIDLSELNGNEFVRIFFNINFGNDKADVYIDNIRVEDATSSAIKGITAPAMTGTRIYTIDGKAVHGIPTEAGLYIIVDNDVARKVLIK